LGLIVGKLPLKGVGRFKNYLYVCSHILKPKTKKIKKLFAILAIAGVMVACNNKKKDEKKPEGDSTATTTTTTTTGPETTTTTTSAGTPTFSDPTVQKFVDDYTAFIVQYKEGMKDLAKLAELSKSMQEWSTKGTDVGMKLATNPEDLQKWTAWWQAISKELMPEVK
jgi:hypothetical protein